MGKSPTSAPRSRARVTPARTGSRSSSRPRRPTRSGWRYSSRADRPTSFPAASARATRSGLRRGCACTATTTAVEADLNWIVGWKKDDFIGAGVLREQKANGAQRKIVGFEMLERGIGRHGYDAFIGDAKV